MPADRSHSPGPSASRDDDGVAGTSTGSRKRVKKFTRTRTGCLSCRKSKHKCDEQVSWMDEGSAPKAGLTLFASTETRLRSVPDV